MKTKLKFLLFLKLHPVNFPLALAASLLGFRVFYWKVTNIPKRFLSRFIWLNPMEFLTLDDWLMNGQRAYYDWMPSHQFWSDKSLVWNVCGTSVDFGPSWLQKLAYHYDEYCKFLEIASSFKKRHVQEGEVRTAGTFLSKFSGELRVSLPKTDVSTIQWFGFLDQMWFWLLALLTCLKSSADLFMKPSVMEPIEDVKSIRFIFSDISPGELAEEKSKLDFAFLIESGLLEPSEVLYLLPALPSPRLLTRMKALGIRWTLRKECLWSLGWFARAKAFFSLLGILIFGFFNFKDRITVSTTLFMALKSVSWVLLGQKMNLTAYISTVGASWPETPDVAAINALGVRTINWFYSVNNFGGVQNNASFNDKNLENSIWVAKEVWGWSQMVVDWFRHRHIHSPGHPVKFAVMGPAMCGDPLWAEQTPSQARAKFGLLDESDFKYIGVFDVPVLNDSSRVRLGLGPTLYSSEMGEKFYEDVLQLIREIPNVKLLLKLKRALSSPKRDCPKSLKQLLDFDTNHSGPKRVILIDHDVDPYLSIAMSDCFIGMPFTSPVLFGLRKDRRAVYYDPLGTFRFFFPSTLEPLIVRSQVELINRIKSWINDGHNQADSSASNDSLVDCDYHLGPNGVNPSVRFVNLLKEVQ